ncbi:reverse transcriptase domain-containing protein [Agromyces atrinae]|uniref:reverse transcriptase domain-containing protein n=1 Tax=Agromyces atrinae TaxID=592376 RepID=UPI001F57D48E|nr:reverse transcriptase domain-containing protein [Agromyces atrinae]MCI2957195.1 reverse transcriptase domain-containing protein [Agromyces atrinae]
MSELGLDLIEGAKVANRDKYGDWYRDPWGWPELDLNFVRELTVMDLGISKDGKNFVYRGAPIFQVIDMPKSFLGTRPAVVQDSRSRLAFASAVNALSAKLHGDLPDWVFGWRHRGTSLASNGDEWSRYRSSQSDIGESRRAAQTDLTSFFASVDNQKLLRRLREKAGNSAALSIVTEVLGAHQELSTRSGLPQRSTSSSLLAQLAVGPIDDELESALASGQLIGVRRWMDDISFEGEERVLVDMIARLQARGREVGLELNMSKTRILSGPDSAAELALEDKKRIEVRRRESDLHLDYVDDYSVFLDDTEIDRIESEVLADPAVSSRTSAGLILRSLRYYELFDRVEEWSKAAPYLPHVADHLSRYLAAANDDPGVNLLAMFDGDKWFVEQSVSGWPYLDWVSAQHALVLPSASLSAGSKGVLRTWLRHSRGLQNLAVSVQRLAVDEPAATRAHIRERIEGGALPLESRLLALGYLFAGGDHEFAERVLKIHPSNQLIHRYLQSKNWELPQVSHDFDPSDGP